MDFGPHGSADVTENLTESVPCGPVVHDPAEPEQDPQGLPYLHIKAPFHALDSPVVQEVCDLLMMVSPSVRLLHAGLLPAFLHRNAWDQI